MISRYFRSSAPVKTLAKVALVPALAFLLAVPTASAQDHGRKYKPMDPTAHITVTVQKGYNGKPIMNAAVVFHAERDGHNDGNLEVKTDEDGNAVIDVIEIGSKVTVQVIANGFATAARQMDVDGPTKTMLIKMQEPRAQMSQFENNDGKAATVKPGVQEPPHDPAQHPVVKAGTPQ